MSNKILFLVEGEKTEPGIIKNIASKFISSNNSIISYGTNIYQLYNELEKDTDLDLLNLLLENKKIKHTEFSEIYLFFDFDAQAVNNINQVNEILLKMLNKFNNETENGLLYISYPMFESIYDYDSNFNTKKHISKKCYKRIEGNFKNHPNIQNLYITCCKNNIKTPFIDSITKEHWIKIFLHHLNKRKYLLDKKLNLITEEDILSIQMGEYEKNKEVYTLSAIPPFIYDYLNDKSIFNNI